MISAEDIILRLDKIIQLLQNGNIVSSVVVTENKVECPFLFDYLDFWVKNFKVGKVKDSTLIQIKSVIKNHIKKNFENKRLSEYCLMDIQNSLMSVSFSRMREYAYSVLNDAFKKACQLKYITENFVSLVEIPAHKRQEGRALTKEQEKLFFEKAKSSKFYKAFLFMRFTGCRPSETFRVKWSDVDFEKKSIWLDGTKTDLSARLVPLVPVLNKVLNTIERKGDYIFDGMTADGAKHAISRVVVPFEISCKDFRTTFATWCSHNGVQPHTLQKWLGHTTYNTTSKYYVKVLSEFEKSEVVKIGGNRLF